jgi:hypothetical protein
MITHKQSGVDHLKTQINGKKCIYAPTLNWVQSDKANYYNIHLTVKEHFARRLENCKHCLSWSLTEVKQYDKIINRLMKSIDDNGKIVNDVWLKRIANNIQDFECFDKLVGPVVRAHGHNFYLCDAFDETLEQKMYRIKCGIKRAVKPLQADAKEVKKLIKLYK